MSLTHEEAAINPVVNAIRNETPDNLVQGTFSHFYGRSVTRKAFDYLAKSGEIVKSYKAMGGNWVWSKA